jgi:hypothetical protein
MGTTNIREFSNNESASEFLTEAKYSRVANIFRGLHPDISKIGILTAQNAQRKVASDDPEENIKTNQELNDSLERNLKNANFRHFSVRGKYGISEDIFIVYEIFKDEVLKLGKRYDQESFIYGEFYPKSRSFIFEMIRCEDGTVLDSRRIFVKDDTQQDYHTEAPSKQKAEAKFSIPFIDTDEYPTNREFPDLKDFLDKLSQSEKRKFTNEVNNLMEENRSPKSKWLHRGVIKMRLP